MPTRNAADQIVTVDVQVAGGVTGVPDRRFLRRWVAAALAQAVPGLACEVGLRVVDEAEGGALNLRYRGRQTATNVLSFPAPDMAPGALPPEIARPLGDIVVCAPLVSREAANQGKANRHHWAHLLVHGALHLAGHDHESSAEARAMEALETAILASGGVPDPYAPLDAFRG